MKNYNIVGIALIMSVFGSASALAMGKGKFAAKNNHESVDLKHADGKLTTRYQNTKNKDGVLVKDDLQYRLELNVGVSFFNDKVEVNAQALTGKNAWSSYSDTGIGMSNTAGQIDLRRLSITTRPGHNTEISLGSMGPEIGAGTEYTTMDTDGYIMGYRAHVTVANGSIVVTGGYVGDFLTPNVFDRFGRMDELNYLQVVLNRSIGELVRSSLEYNRVDGQDIVRIALNLNVSKWTSFADSITIEKAVGLSNEDTLEPASFALAINKTFKKLAMGRDLNTVLAYHYNTEDKFRYHIGDKAVDGRSVRMRLEVPKAIRLNEKTAASLYLEYIDSVDHRKNRRFEMGSIVKF